MNPTPYHVWVSEIMLQQTRIEAVLPYYQRFISALPDIESLATVDEETLLKLWEGLGYYTRARNLQKSARILLDRHQGEFPKDYDLILSLPGIGAYTAGAIASIAFSIPVPAVDGNVMRVLARLTGNDTDVLSTKGKKIFEEMAWSLVPEKHPGRFNQALMELGETICLPNGAPRCHECPLRDECVAFRDHLTDRLPVRIKKVKRRTEEHSVAVVIAEGDAPKVLLHRRDPSGLLAGLWELPNTLSAEPTDSLLQEICADAVYAEQLCDAKHLFSHIEWRMRGYLYRVNAPTEIPSDYVWATLQDLQQRYPIPSAFSAYTKLLSKLLQKEN